jgi:hypothetical protein
MTSHAPYIRCLLSTVLCKTSTIHTTSTLCTFRYSFSSCLFSPHLPYLLGSIYRSEDLDPVWKCFFFFFFQTANTLIVTPQSPLFAFISIPLHLLYPFNCCFPLTSYCSSFFFQMFCLFVRHFMVLFEKKNTSTWKISWIIFHSNWRVVGSYISTFGVVYTMLVVLRRIDKIRINTSPLERLVVTDSWIVRLGCWPWGLAIREERGGSSG